MHTKNISDRDHNHVFNSTNLAAEQRTWAVMWITASMMVLEIVAGWWYNSMALLADGWHMSSHMVAIGVSAFAYRVARKFADDQRFAFGTWKIEVLGGFTSALFLIVVAAAMVVGSVERILIPQTINFTEAIAVAVLGLLVNLFCAVILGQVNKHEHEYHGDHEHIHDDDHDLNLKSAYLHVIADAATSVLAIVALLGGANYGWQWLDPLMGIVGAGLVVLWGKNMMFQTGKVLLDCEMDHPIVEKIHVMVGIEFAFGDTRISDIHVWRVAKNAFSCAISIITHDETLDVERVSKMLCKINQVAHSTVEIRYCN